MKSWSCSAPPSSAESAPRPGGALADGAPGALTTRSSSRRGCSCRTPGTGTPAERSWDVGGGETRRGRGRGKRRQSNDDADSERPRDICRRSRRRPGRDARRRVEREPLRRGAPSTPSVAGVSERGVAGDGPCPVRSTRPPASRSSRRTSRTDAFDDAATRACSSCGSARRTPCTDARCRYSSTRPPPRRGRGRRRPYTGGFPGSASPARGAGRRFGASFSRRFVGTLRLEFGISRRMDNPSARPAEMDASARAPEIRRRRWLRNDRGPNARPVRPGVASTREWRGKGRRNSCHISTWKARDTATNG